MLYLDVPYPDKDLAKQQGARWDPVAKKWYVADAAQVDLTLFARWLPPQKDLGLNDAAILTAEKTTDSAETTDELAKSVSLSSLLAKVQNTLQQGFPQAIWVRAEIANLSERRGHLYLELSENDEQGQTLANCRAMIWASNATRLVDRFQQVTGSPLKDGQKVLIQVSVNFHEKFGFSLVVQDLDPNFTLGEMEANLIAIRKQLISEGIYQLNKQLSLPPDLFRVAVISPPNAAGLGDFRAEADMLEKYKLCEFTYFHSAFQGDQVLSEMLSAFDAFAAIHTKKPFDVLAIIRGGGAKLDLNPLNQYELAKAITQVNIPVLSGIGHERDNTILDEVACMRFDTPSKVIGGIWHIISDSAKQAKQNWQLIERQSQQTLLRFQAQLQQLKQGIDFGQQRVFGLWQTRVEPLYVRIQHTSSQRIQQEHAKLDQLMHRLSANAQHQTQLLHERLDSQQQVIQQQSQRLVVFYRQQLKQTMGFILSSGPQSQLKRGFAIAKTLNGQPIAHATEAYQAQHFNITFQDGDVHVRVEQDTPGIKSAQQNLNL